MLGVEETYNSLTALEGNVVAVHPQRCVLVRNRNARCLRCAEVCTSGAISVSEDAIAVDERKCIGCGTCATACPTCALEVREPGDKELFEAIRDAMRAGGGNAVVACAESGVGMESNGAERAGFPPASTPVASVKCLGRVDESLLVGALAAPWAEGVTLLHGDCETCPHKAGHGIASSVVESANTILATWGARPRVRMERAGLAEVSSEPLEARGEVGCGSDAVAPFQLEKVGADGTLPHHVPARRKRLVGALAALGPAPDADLETRLWGHVSIDVDRCVSCRMCTTFCPAGAIVKWDEDGNFGLAHQARLCVKCRCCESICPVGAIELSESVSARSLVDGDVDYLPLEKPAFQRGDGHATKKVFGSLLGMEEIFDR